MLKFFLDNELKPFLKGNLDHIFSQVFSLNGEVFRLVKNRKTFRFSYNQKNYFVKIHRGVGWKEIFKCLLQGKCPVLSAENEYSAIRHLEQLNIPTMTCRAFAVRGNNPAEMESFLITDELQNVVSLEDFTKNYTQNVDKTILAELYYKFALVSEEREDDEIILKDGKVSHSTNNAGGIEGGMTNGEDLVIKAVMKPIPTMTKPLKTVDKNSHELCEAHFERSDVCAVESCAVVAENRIACVLADEFLQKFPSFEPYIKRYMGADDLINDTMRFCLWLKDCPPSLMRSSSLLMQRLEGVRKSRLASSKASTREWANKPYLFTEDRQPNDNYIILPVVSSAANIY